MNKEVTEMLSRSDQWKKEMLALRKICLSTELTEEFKWKQPVYTFNDKNVCIIGSFKDFCTLSFFKGALLKDPEDMLEKAGENTRSARIVKITGIEQVKKRESILKKYISEAIRLEKDGKEFDFSKNREMDIPKELKQLFNTDKEFQKAFESLTPGRKRGYLIFFNGAKQTFTITNRIEKYREKIMQGKGMNDYK